MKINSLRAALLVSGACVGVVSPTYAQTAPDGRGGANTTADAEQSDVGGQKNDTIVVTGSRVITNGNNSPTPLTVVTTQELVRRRHQWHRFEVVM